MARLSIFALLLSSFLLPQSASGQNQPRRGQILLVVPFENTSDAPGIDWIGEGFSEVLTQRLTASGAYAIGREDRLYAFDRLGIPAGSRPSRATLIRIAQEMDADFLVTGSYDFDGRTFTGKAELVNLKRLRMQGPVNEAGALTQLNEIENALAWDLLRMLDPTFPISRKEYLASLSTVRLDAFENYIRGSIAGDLADKVKHFKEAIRLNPAYYDAMLRLGRAYYDAHDYDAAAVWLGRVPRSESMASEANFYLGLASYYAGNYERAEDAFRFVSTKVPLLEVYNDLGVVIARRGGKGALELFQRVAQADTRDPDYRFNLAVSLYRNGNNAAATRQLKEALQLRPQDSEAQALLTRISSGAPYSATSPADSISRPPLERVKSNYDESSYRQLALEIQNAQERRYSGMTPEQHAAAHIANGNNLLNQNLDDQAADEFREAILLDPTQPGAHIGLATVLERENQLAEARDEAVAASRLQPSAAAFVLLSRIQMKENNLQGARETVEKALKLEPENTEANALSRAIAAQLAEKAQPLPQR